MLPSPKSKSSSRFLLLDEGVEEAEGSSFMGPMDPAGGRPGRRPRGESVAPETRNFHIHY